jgi:DNA-binding NarL/FixJ family response regulator
MRLTPREDQVAQLCALRLTYQLIGDRLGCSRWTVRAHVRAIAAKIGPDDMPAKIRVQVWAADHYRRTA